MATTRITPGQLPGALRKEARATRGAVQRGMTRAAHRGKARLIQATDESGKVDQGQYKNSFSVKRRGQGVSLLNDAPHAGVIELGARPHPVSEAGVDSIRRWVARKLLGISIDLAEQNEEVDAIAWGIVNKLRREGQEPTYIVRNEQRTLARYLREETERVLRERRDGGGGPPPEGDPPGTKRDRLGRLRDERGRFI